MGSPNSSPLLGTSKRSSSHFFKLSSIQSSDERIEASQFSTYRSIAILERKASAQIGDRGANMRVVRGGHFWQLGSIASLATETAGGVILVAFWP